MSATRDRGGLCEWFALCEREADHTEPHPAFPAGVPTCRPCGEWIASMGGDTRESDLVK